MSMGLSLKAFRCFQVEELLLSEPNNEEYAEIYNSLREVRALCVLVAILRIPTRATSCVIHPRLARAYLDPHSVQWA
jgi:hypothetical protein